MLSQAAVVIEGRRAAQLTLVGATAIATPVLDHGLYDCWCDVDCFIRVARYDNTSPNRAIDVTALNGYKITAGNVVPVQVSGGRMIGVIAGGAGTFNYHKSA